MLCLMRRYTSVIILYLVGWSPETTTRCPEGGAMYYGPDYQMCFYIVDNTSTKCSSKQAACAIHGGVLSHVPDKGASAFLFMALSEVSHYRIVLGLNDMAVEGNYVTYAGDVQEWINWDTDQPDNYRGEEDCCVLYAKDNSMVVNDHACSFELKHSRVLCHLDISPELRSYSFDGLNDTTRKGLFSLLHSPSKGIIGAQLQNVVVRSVSMCAILCYQDDNCHFFVYPSTDGMCSTHAVPIIQPTLVGSTLQVGTENVWVGR